VPPRLRLVAIGLAVLLTAAGCAGPAQTGWIERGSTSSPATTNETGAPVAATTPKTPGSTTTEPSPDPVPSTGSSSLAGPACCPGGSDPACEVNSAAGAAYLAANIAGGTFGFRFARVGEGVLASLNPEHSFYPASSIKVLAHLHAARWVAAQPDPEEALATPIPVYDDPCAALGTHQTEPLAAVLAAMMIDSDNRRANAVVDHFGRDAINATGAGVAGLSDTVLAHRFGCGGPANDPANRSTALDLSRVYERVAAGEVLDAEAGRIFTSLMLGPVWPSLEAAVAAEGEALGLGPETVEAFRGAIDLSYKAGWWDTHLSIGGLLGLPTGGCEGDPPRQYAFAVFVDGADRVADGFDVSDLVAVVLREEIRTALAEAAASPCAP
jgi:hypothetical protein